LTNFSLYIKIEIIRVQTLRLGGLEFFLDGWFGLGETTPRKNSKLLVPTTEFTPQP